MTKEIAYDDLEYTSKGIFLLDGLPFTGKAHERDVNGNCICEIEFNMGKEHGMARGFFSNGSVKQETSYVAGKKHGTEKEWFENGRIKQECVFEFGVMMKSKGWASDGKLVNEFLRPCDDYLFKLVEKERKKR